MAGSKICCPVGKVYDPTTDLCWDLNRLNATDPIDCPCCPVGFSYDSLTGVCVNPSKSVQTSTIVCPCCPTGYFYYSLTGRCLLTVNPSNATAVDPIPCITCNCVDPDDPTCTDCGSDGLPVTFAFNPNVKNCTDCEPHDITNPPGGIQSFLPEQFLDPVTNNFVLRNKNFI